MRVEPDRLLFIFDERILIYLKSDSFYLPTVRQNTENGDESIEKDRNSVWNKQGAGVSAFLTALRLDAVYPA